MISLSTHTRIGDLVADRPSRSRLFARLGIDFCCGGKKTLEQACREQQLDPGEVLSALVELPPVEGERSWVTAPLAQLCDHIQVRHHDFTRAEIPRVGALLDKVARVHGARHPEMIEVAAVFAMFGDEMLTHMLKEERVLFPAIARLGSGARLDLSSPIAVMLREHDGAAAAFARMRELVPGFVPPAGACGTFRAALDGLAELEADLHQHVHLENNVLFPRALGGGASDNG
jgi:regulator of cell morphogenesis and NO signaling